MCERVHSSVQSSVHISRFLLFSNAKIKQAKALLYGKLIQYSVCAERRNHLSCFVIANELKRECGAIDIEALF